MISTRNVTKRFGGVVALSEVNVEIAAGEFHAIVGENGAGKSTLMKIFAGVLTDFEGELRLRGEPVRFSGTRDAESAGISIIHQELNLVSELTAAANIFLGRERRTSLGLLDDRAMERETAALFERLNCEIAPDVRVGALRVGDQQLVEIAKALSLESDILIMDEPTSALTESEVARLFGVIEQLQAQGVTILYISHKMDEVFRLADRITVLRDGEKVATLEANSTSVREITHLMVGREIEDVDLGDQRQPGDVLLRLEEVSLPWTGHARQWRLKEISLELRAGEVVGIAGLMGAGRTELLECLFGTSPEPPVGRILVEGNEVGFAHPAEAMQAGIALVTEDRKQLGLFDQMNVRENITLCVLRNAADLGLVSPRREQEIVDREIAAFGIKTDGVDVGAKAEIYRIIDSLCRDGMGILVTSSELPELMTLCDRILVLCEGRLTGEFERSEFAEEAIMEAATRRETVVVP
eukprot:g26537.t1